MLGGDLVDEMLSDLEKYELIEIKPKGRITQKYPNDILK